MIAWAPSTRVCPGHCVFVLAMFICASTPPLAAAQTSQHCLSDRNCAECTRNDAAQLAKPSARFDCASMLARSGDYVRAVALYTTMIIESPGNVDYWFGLAQTQFWSGDVRGSLETLANTRSIAPHYEDVWKLELQILDSQGGGAAGRKAQELRVAAEDQFPGASWIYKGAPVRRPKYRWEIGADFEDLDNGASDWQRVYARVDRSFGATNSIFLRLAEYERFDQRDSDLGFGATFMLSERWIASGAITLSASPDFLPETIVNVRLSRKLLDGWLVGLVIQDRQYPFEDVISNGLVIERYFGQFHAAYQLEQSRLSSQDSWNHRATLNFYPDVGGNYGLIVTDGEETEVVAPGQLLNTDVNSIVITGRHPVGKDMSILWRLGSYRQGSLYRRNMVGLSVAGAF